MLARLSLGTRPWRARMGAGWRSRLALGLGLLALAGCGVEFDPASEISGLRVLAVKKSSPYARPGERVDLSLLWHDSVAGRPPPQIAWVAVCENPPADLFE